jgi:hypothetical protein
MFRVHEQGIGGTALRLCMEADVEIRQERDKCQRERDETARRRQVEQAKTMRIRRASEKAERVSPERQQNGLQRGREAVGYALSWLRRENLRESVS